MEKITVIFMALTWMTIGFYYNFASRGREYPFGHSRPACRDTRTRETRLAAWLGLVAKIRFSAMLSEKILPVDFITADRYTKD